VGRLFDPKDVPELSRSVGPGIRGLRTAQAEERAGLGAQNSCPPAELYGAPP